jgi:hypothetical protein
MREFLKHYKYFLRDHYLNLIKINGFGAEFLFSFVYLERAVFGCENVFMV